MRLWCEDPEIDVKHVLYIQLVSISMGLTGYEIAERPRETPGDAERRRGDDHTISHNPLYIENPGNCLSVESGLTKFISFLERSEDPCT